MNIVPRFGVCITLYICCCCRFYEKLHQGDHIDFREKYKKQWIKKESPKLVVIHMAKEYNCSVSSNFYKNPDTELATNSYLKQCKIYDAVCRC